MKVKYSLNPSKENRLLIFESLTSMLEAGIDLRSGLAALIADENRKIQKEYLEDMYTQISSGQEFYKIIKNFKLVPEFIQPLVEVGEKSGSLANQMRTGLELVKTQQDIANKIRVASIYPGLVISILLAVSVFVFYFTFPNLIATYEGLDSELPASTEFLISFTGFLQETGFYTIPLFFTFFFGISFLVFYYKKTRFIGQWLLLKFPPTGNLITSNEISRFASLTGILTKSGFPIIKAIEITSKTTEFVLFQKSFQHIASELYTGKSFGKIFKDSKMLQNALPIFIQQSLITGEKTGSISNNLIKASSYYKKRAENMVNTLMSLLEPALIIIVWLGVSFIALAIVLPIYSLIDGVSLSSVG